MSTDCKLVLFDRFTTFDFTRPKRMSYYPHNQPLMNAHGGEEVEGEPSFDMPRSSSHTMHTAGSFTHSQSGMVDTHQVLATPEGVWDAMLNQTDLGKNANKCVRFLFSSSE